MEASRHIRSAVTAQIVEKKSRFIAYLTPVSGEEEALSFIQSIKKKHFDARHNCYAYITKENTRSSDDGEPSPTAGRPMLDALSGAGLSDVCVVVTRYFGGMLLGTGGLTRAYKGAVNAALELAETYELVTMAKLGITTGYQEYTRISRLGGENGDIAEGSFGPVAIRNLNYSDKVSFNMYCLPERKEELTRSLTDMTQGQIEITELGYEEL